MDNGYVKKHLVNDIMTIEFFHPLSNSLPSNLLDNLATLILEENNNHSYNTIILKSTGVKAFCAGASFDELLSIKNKEEGTSFFSGFAKVINACRKSNKIILGRIHGKTVGGGVGIAAACDYTLATKHASIKLSELSIGIGPFVISPVVIKAIGNRAFSSLTINASEWKDAYWAKDKNLYAEVFENTDDLDSHIIHLANQINSYNPEAVKEIKSIFWNGTENWDHLLNEKAKQSGKLVLSEFTKQALQKFKQLK
jgi:methylglutaconyl-CoA hydratase